MQFHVWEDVMDKEWKEAIQKLTKRRQVKHWGISVNRWEE
jgi:hypothetical protein